MTDRGDVTQGIECSENLEILGILRKQMCQNICNSVSVRESNQLRLRGKPQVHPGDRSCFVKLLPLEIASEPDGRWLSLPVFGLEQKWTFFFCQRLLDSSLKMR